MEPDPNRAHGENHPRAKLTDYQVHEMRDDYELRKMTMREIAAKYGASWHTVRKILRYQRRTYVIYRPKPND